MASVHYCRWADLLEVVVAVEERQTPDTGQHHQLHHTPRLTDLHRHNIVNNKLNTTCTVYCTQYSKQEENITEEIAQNKIAKKFTFSAELLLRQEYWTGVKCQPYYTTIYANP